MKYRKKPIEVEAIQWTGDNVDEIYKFVDGKASLIFSWDKSIDNKFRIETLEGNLYAAVGDYIIKGIQGEYYPCKPDIFHDTYEVIE